MQYFSQVLTNNLKIFLDSSKKITYQPPASWIRETLSEPDSEFDASLIETVARNLKRKSIEMNQPFKKFKCFENSKLDQCSFYEVSGTIDHLYKTMIEEKNESDIIEKMINNEESSKSLRSQSYSNLEEGLELLKSALDDEKLEEKILTKKLLLFS